MKKYFVAVLILYLTFLVLNSCYAQAPAIEWAKCYGGSLEDFGRYILQTDDGGYIACGEEWSVDGQVSGNHGGSDYWVIKIDSSGNLLWEKSFGGSQSEVPYTLQQTIDGGYVLAGNTRSNDSDVIGNHGNGSIDYWILKLDGLGNMQWQKCLGGSGNDWGRSIQQTYEGGYIVAGYTESNDSDVSGNHGSEDYWIVKLNSTGDLRWQKALGGTDYEEAYSVIQTTDSGFVVAGYTISNDGDVSGNHGGNGDAWIVKLDTNGSLVWQKCFGGTNGDGAYSIQQTDDGGYIVAGSARSNDGDVSGVHGGVDYWILKLDSSGTIQWQKCLGGSGGENAYSIKQTRDHGYVVAGYSTSNDSDVTGNHGNEDYWIVQLDSVGNLKWQKCLGGSGPEYTFSIQQTRDSGFIAVGWTGSNDGDVIGNHGNLHVGDFWLVKLFSTSVNISENEQEIISLTAYLSDADNLSITFSTLQSTNLNLTLTDITGRILLTQKISATAGFNNKEIPVVDLANGIYIVTLNGGVGIASVKVITESDE